jgi:hypothetical protein
MDNDEKLKLLYENSSALHRYFLDWRYKLLAGYIVIISALGYFILTWIQKPEHYTALTYILTCSCGIIISLLFYFINHRITKLLWQCQNKAYLIEKDLGFKANSSFQNTQIGIYGRFVTEGIRNDLDNGKEDELEKNSSGLLNPFNHSGILNWFFILVVIFYIILITQTCNLYENKKEWLKTKIECEK